MLKRKKLKSVAGLLLTALALVGPAAALTMSEPVSRGQMGEQWPLTVDAGTLSCGGQVVSFRANGITYAVNGSAKAYGQKLGWRDVREIWRDNPDAQGTKVDIGPLIRKGTELCRAGASGKHSSRDGA